MFNNLRMTPLTPTQYDTITQAFPAIQPVRVLGGTADDSRLRVLYHPVDAALIRDYLKESTE